MRTPCSLHARRILSLPLSCILIGSVGATAVPWQAVAAQEPIPSIAEKTRGMTRMEGLFDLYWQESTGMLFWEINELDREFLYQISMGSGLGSNPVGIDRGQLNGSSVITPMRVGPRILLMERNYRFVANSDNALEVSAVRDAFAPSVHWGFDIAAESD